MRVSAAGDAACRLVVSLALHPTAEPTSVSTLAARTGLPPPFAGQLLASCRRAGILTARRGRNGGYYLNGPPEQVTLAEVINAIDGPIAPGPSITCTETNEETIGAEVLGTVWTGVSAEARIRLGKISIEDIVQRASGSVSSTGTRLVD
ncbi:MAG TPA: Rrf2 family transcriptional regulator [Acidimicrobiales bacterium]|nr:Rrf2 family transcriptional regulator [Acidimicrobiales bacterium]